MNLNYGLLFALFPEGGELYFVFHAIFFLLSMLAGYFLGGINSAIIVSRTLFHDDVRTHGSGNPGLTNMFRVYGKKGALLTLAGDLLKTVVAIFIGGFLLGFYYVGGISLGEGCYIAGLFAVVGHIFPCYYKFKGGKGVLATATMALVLSPIPFLILFAVFASIVALTKYVSLGSVTAAVLYPVVVYGYFKVVFIDRSMPGMVSLAVILIAILIVVRHTKNLQRIGNQTENKFSFKRKHDDDTSH